MVTSEGTKKSDTVHMEQWDPVPTTTSSTESIGRLLAPTAHQQVRCSRWLLAPSLTFSSGDDVGFSPRLSQFQFLLRFLGSLVPINFRCPQSIASSSLELLTRFFGVCGVSTARVISTASSLRRPVSGVSGGSAASSSGDDSPVVVSLVWSRVGVCSGETSGRSSSFPANLGVWGTDVVIG
ncbi:hypothetical protein IGI04_001785 [Brassica rapa subsp. trilocularis]|uniref:Uncharacterized protein n=1 Tax=Brassica rapa subsp. trilocularis TaxID=1813537 RepID=A0ABQ7NTL8_BRACM|nr:hypothetical protein IGI04_001785 [Brassica rapa subsp. trilocularis]